ncbi:MAG: hypothetical protein K1000chlam4_00520 [Chlamydiae bacterium]|nr:hypothetical protein [Chlamydiota bacterium]
MVSAGGRRLDPSYAVRLKTLVRERGVEPYPGSIVDYCPLCKVEVRISPKSQKSIKNRGAVFFCPLCMETKVLPAMNESGNEIVMQASNQEDLDRFANMAARAGSVTIPLGQIDAPICESCDAARHSACFGQGCGCRPCQTAGPVAGL